MPKSRPLATHLALTHGAMGLLACLATGLALAVFLPRVYVSQRQSALIQEGQALASEVAPWLAENPQEPAPLLARPEGTGVIVVDARQQILARSVGRGRGGRGWGPRGMGMMRGPAAEVERVWKQGWDSVTAGQVVQETVAASGAQSEFVAVIPAEHGGKVVGAVVLHARLAELRGAANALIPLIALASLAAALVAVAAGAWLSRRMARPLRRMTEAAQKVAAGDLNVRVAPPSWREGESLALAFNTMTQSLAAEEAARRQFIADASHQLRAPLTSLQAQAEALLDDMVSGEPSRRTFLLRMVEETRRLSALAEQLLDLERLDSGQKAPNLQAVDIASLLRRVAQAFSTESPTRLDLQLPRELLPAQADPEEVRQALVNLVDNALKHTPGDGRVRLSAAVEGKMMRVAVADQGPGIAPQHLPHIWGRFFRVPGDSTEGSGLGLAIAKRLVERQCGQVSVESTPGQGSIFSFTLPIMSS